MSENLVKDWLLIIRSQLAEWSDSPLLDAQVLIAHVFGKPRTWVLAHPEAVLVPEQERVLAEALARLRSGEALPYVLGRWEFFGLDFIVTRDVLIPRPETELLVEQALGWLRSQSGRLALDVGTGSGCIAITLAVLIPNLKVIGSDMSLPALNVARKNAQAHGVQSRVAFLQADLAPPVAAAYDLICANLPYIPVEKLDSLRVARREPGLALDGGKQGLDLIGKFIQAAPKGLAEGGLLLLEIEASQGEAVCCLAQQAFPQAEVRLLADLAGRDRLVRVQNP